MKIKVCGMRNAQNIKELDLLPIDFMGFIFYPKSSRYVSQKPDYLPQNCKRVGVFVDEALHKILEIRDKFQLDFVQLHGSESVDFCRLLKEEGVGVIKAFGIDNQEFPIDEVAKYENECLFFIFDTKTPSYGGSGQQFNWSVINQYIGQTPFLLSGGIGLDDAESIKDISHPKFVGIDLNSKFEISPAQKNIELLTQFIKNIKQ